MSVAEVALPPGWVCSAPEPKTKPADRLAYCLALARTRFRDGLPPTVYVHPATAAETPATASVQIVAHEAIPRPHYWFPLADVES